MGTSEQNPLTASAVPAPAQRNALVHLAGGALATAIFALDLVRPLDEVVAMLYVLVILLGLWTQCQAYPAVAAVTATTLVAIDLIAGWETPPPTSVLINAPLIVLVLIATAALVSRFRRLEDHSGDHIQQLADLKRALDAAAIVATTDVTGRITYVNEKFCEISQYTREELLGQDHRVINSAFHPPAFIRDLWRTIATGHVWHGEIRNRAKGGHLYWVDTTIVPFLDVRGKPYQYIAIRSDISARKEAEARLVQQAALAQVGQLAAVVAHEVKNPLAGVKGAIQVLMSNRRTDDPELKVMHEIVARVDALNELIGDLMVFARPRAPRLAPVNLGSLLANAVEQLRRDPAGAGLSVTMHVPDITVEADGELVRAAVLNLLINAQQAMGGTGTLTIAALQTNDSASIDVRDSGPGIPPEIREHIFDPFFTTKSKGGGLGLPVARRTAELHGGTLTCACPPEGGTVMTLTLPTRASHLATPVR